MTSTKPVEDDIVKSIHIHQDDVPWLVTGTGMDFRILQAHAESQLVSMQFRADPGHVSALHRHNGPSVVFTLAGTWGHRREVTDYLPGTYVYEPVGAVHRFYAGPDPVEIMSVDYGSVLEFFDEDSGEITMRLDYDAQVAGYFQGCEAAGLPRPNILR
jgi:2,4'-dihydroxyacetophenone dioxygenase